MSERDLGRSPTTHPILLDEGLDLSCAGLWCRHVNPPRTAHQPKELCVEGLVLLHEHLVDGVHQQRSRRVGVLLRHSGPPQEGHQGRQDLGRILTNRVGAPRRQRLGMLVDGLGDLLVRRWGTRHHELLHILAQVLTHDEDVDIAVGRPQLPILFGMQDAVVDAIEPLPQDAHLEGSHFALHDLDERLSLQQR